MQRRQSVGTAALLAFIGTIFAANWFLAHVGIPTGPGGPRVVPVGFGFAAPSGVLWVGLALTLRDAVQVTLGRRAVAGAIAVGAVLSYAVAPAYALASALAFGVSELLDLAAFTPLAARGRLAAAVLASNTVGAVADSVLFLGVAFGSLAFLPGQVLGKLWMTLPVLLVLPAVRARLAPAAAGPSPAGAT